MCELTFFGLSWTLIGHVPAGVCCGVQRAREWKLIIGARIRDCGGDGACNILPNVFGNRAKTRILVLQQELGDFFVIGRNLGKRDRVCYAGQVENMCAAFSVFHSSRRPLSCNIL